MRYSQVIVVHLYSKALIQHVQQMDKGLQHFPESPKMDAKDKTERTFLYNPGSHIEPSSRTCETLACTPKGSPKGDKMLLYKGEARPLC